jgi:catechol 2,3-dioxygenase-like lactoylglutathione lyase family enzyme
VLTGKVLVDVSIGFTPDGALAHPDASLGEGLQEAFPDARVVKTLCTMTASVMRDPRGLGGPSTVFLSGDDEKAKATVGALLTDLGWPETAQLDLGGIATARGQEHFALLFLGVAGALGTHTFNVRVVPEAQPGPAFRAARAVRRSHEYAESVAFYRDVVGLPVVHIAEDGPDDFAIAIFGLPEPSATFELVQAAEPVPADRHEQLVLYFTGPAARDEVAARLTAAGHEPVDQYRYWTLNEAVTFLDPDGRELVLAPWVFGEEPPPMRRRAEPRG